MYVCEGDRALDYRFVSGNNSANVKADVMIEQQHSCRESIMDKHEEVMREILYLYKSLVKENKVAVEEIEQECRQMVNRDMAYAIKFIDDYDVRLDMKRLSAAMDDMVFLYGLSDLLERGLVLVRNLVPEKGRLYAEILRGYFFDNSRNTDEKVLDILPGEISRRQYYREKKAAIRIMGYYFFEVVIPQLHRESRENPFIKRNI